MTGLGFRPDGRAFHPHVTLGRLRETRALKDLVLPVSEQMFGETRSEAIVLFESERRSSTSASGSVYKEICRIDFKPGVQPGLEAAQRQTTAVDLGSPNRPTTSAIEVDDTDDGWPRGHH